MAGEAINPKVNLPRAVMGTILIVTVLYVLAAIALVGMVPYNDISVTSGFPDGFHFRGIEWASQISAVSCSTFSFINQCIALTLPSLFLIISPRRTRKDRRANHATNSRTGHNHGPTTIAICNGCRRTVATNLYENGRDWQSLVGNLNFWRSLRRHCNLCSFYLPKRFDQRRNSLGV